MCCVWEGGGGRRKPRPFSLSGFHDRLHPTSPQQKLETSGFHKKLEGAFKTLSFQCTRSAGMTWKIVVKVLKEPLPEAPCSVSALPVSWDHHARPRPQDSRCQDPGASVRSDCQCSGLTDVTCSTMFLLGLMVSPVVHRHVSLPVEDMYTWTSHFFSKKLSFKISLLKLSMINLFQIFFHFLTHTCKAMNFPFNATLAGSQCSCHSVLNSCRFPFLFLFSFNSRVIWMSHGC